jgi:peptide/nickel transport system substrate-binding protein
MPRGIIVLLLVIFSALSLVFLACGEEAAPEATPAATAEATPASGASTPAPADTPAPTAVPSAQPTRVATPTPGAESMEGVEGQILRDVELADLSLFGCCEDAIIESDGSPHGTFTIAHHFTLTSTWLDPQQHVTAATQQHYDYIVHDAMIKPMPQGIMTYSLAELVEIDANFTMAGFRLREGLKFHDGSDLTTEDVKWTYENYQGFRATTFQGNLDSSRADGGIEVVDDQTIIFHFNKPFIDFLHVYNGGATGISWIVPSDYYESVGAEGFTANPIGVGPFKFVSQDPGSQFVFEAYEDYWRKPPGVQNLVVRGIGGSATPRLAGLLSGDLDLAYGFTGPILPEVLEASEEGKLRWDRNFSATWVLFFPNYEEADSPFNSKNVREAVSLAINRDFLSQVETQALAVPWGNWVPPDIPDVLDITPGEYDPERARELLALEGYGPDNPLELDGFIPFNPYISMGETIIGDLAAVNIVGEIEQYEGPEYRTKRSQGRDGYDDNRTILKSIGILAGPQMTTAFVYADCRSGSSLVCDEEKLQPILEQYEQSLDPAERDQLSHDFQVALHEEFYVVPLYLNAFVHAIGPNVLPEDDGFHDYWATPLSVYAYPWEDWKVKQ